MAEDGCTLRHIAGWYGMKEEEFIQYDETEHGGGLQRLIETAEAAREAIILIEQSRLARQGDKLMLKHLGETVLGQSTKIKVDGEINHKHDVLMTILDEIDGKTAGLPACTVKRD